MIRWRSLVLVAMAGALVPVCFCTTALTAPPPTPVDTVTDTLFGVAVADPYRWLEDGGDPQVHAWTEAQYRHFRSYVDSYPGRETLEGEIRDLMHVGAITPPQPYGDMYFWTEREAGQDHAVLYMKRGPAGSRETLIDPNAVPGDNTVALDWYFVSPDGALIAYGLSSSGSELSTLYVLDTKSQAMLPDSIPFTRAAALAWEADNTGFYYTRFPEPGTVPSGDENYYRRVYYHELGSDWRNDPLVFGDQLTKTDWPWVTTSPNGAHVFFGAYTGSRQTDLYYRDENGIRLLTEDADAYFEIIPDDGRFFVLTDLDAPGNRVLSGSYDHPERTAWVEIIPEENRTIQSVQVIAHRLVVHSLENAAGRLDIYSYDGILEESITLPTLGSVTSIYGEPGGSEMFFLFESFNFPPTVFRYEFAAKLLSLYDRLDIDIDLSDIDVRMVWYESLDKTPISMFLVGRRDAPRDSANPVLLYGYGGFNVSQKPYFSKTLSLWFKRGGLFAYPHLRGGGEYGERWHRAGMLEQKQNTFDDFIAAAEYLFREGLTSPERLAIEGGSNGGLLIGAVITQRPELCRAAICGVPLLDMLRYHLFLIARLWVPEYGSAEDSAQFAFLHRYSPYHHIRPGENYPALLLTAAESDSRVDPLHARKFAARMQAAVGPNTPILLRIESKAGHGQGKPISRQIEETVDEWCFLFKALGLSLDASN